MAGWLSLLLAVYCLFAAVATLYAETAPGQPDVEKLAEAPRHRWPLLIPLVFLGFVVTAAFVLYGGRRRRRLGGGRTQPGRS